MVGDAQLDFVGGSILLRRDFNPGLIVFLSIFKSVAQKVLNALRERGRVGLNRRQFGMDARRKLAFLERDCRRQITYRAIDHFVHIDRRQNVFFPAGLRFRVQQNLIDHVRQAPSFVLNDRRVLFHVFLVVHDASAQVVRGVEMGKHDQLKVAMAALVFHS